MEQFYNRHGQKITPREKELLFCIEKRIYSDALHAKLAKLYADTIESVISTESFETWIRIFLEDGVFWGHPVNPMLYTELLRDELWRWLYPLIQDAHNRLVARGDIVFEDGKLTTAPRPAPRLTPSERIAIFERDNYRCRICGVSQTKESPIVLHVDHIIPRSKRGSNDPDNLWTLCDECNIGKGARMLNGLDELR